MINPAARFCTPG